MNEHPVKQSCVHIIVPVYNPPEKLFRECLRSISEQSHKNFSCVLVDDGSAPETAALCDKTAVRDSRFTVIHKKNEGTAYARRDGSLAALADGAEYLVYIDSDDTAEPEYISTILGKLLETNSDACFCGANIVCNEKSNFPGWKPSPSESGTSEDRRGMLMSVLDIPHKRFGTRCTLWAGIYRISLLEGVDWEFTKVKIGQDTLLSAQLMLNARKATYLQDRLYNYVQNQTSAINATNTINRWNYIIGAKYAVAEMIKRRIPEFDFTEYCAAIEAQEFNGLLDSLLNSGANGRLLRNETDECIRHIRNAMKTPNTLSQFPRSRHIGILVLKIAGLQTYRLYRLLLKGYRIIR